MPCADCGKPIDSAWPGEKGDVCQMCWERICSEAWWKLMGDLGAAQ